MRLLITGSTGLLGQAICKEALARSWQLTTTARSGAMVNLDISNFNLLEKVLDTIRPDVIVNCAAITDIWECEQDPCLAYKTNAAPVALIAKWSTYNDARLVQISTDHYYTRDSARLHTESDGIELVNEYARSKYAAEAFALTCPRSLVFRTSIVGMRGWERPTLAEWAIDAALKNKHIELFTDAYTSSIDVRSFARAALDISVGPSVGVLNLASRQVYSKAQFVQEIASQLNVKLVNAKLTSVGSQDTVRAMCLGLDVSKAQSLLNYELPGMQEVVRSVISMYRERIGR